MPITLTCSCGKVLRGPDSFAGLAVTCPACGTVSMMPAADDAAATHDTPPIAPSYELESDPFTEAADLETRPAVAMSPTVRDRISRDRTPVESANAGELNQRAIGRTVRSGMFLLSLLFAVGLGWVIWLLATQPSAGTGTPGAAPPLTGYFQLLADARKRGQGVVAGSNMHQIMLALRQYELSHGQWPDTLDDIISENPAMSAVMTNVRTGDSPGFLYVKPKRGAPADTAVLFESLGGRADPEGMVGHVDGSVGKASAP